MPDRRYSATVNSAGAATLTVRPTGTRPWVVAQVSVELVAGTAASVAALAVGELRKNGSLIAPFVAQGDAVAGDPPVSLAPTDEMTIEWTNATPGNRAAALVIFEVG